MGIVQRDLYFHVMPAYYFIRYKAKDKESLKTNHNLKTKLWLSQQHINLDYQIYVKKVKLRVNLIDLKRCTLSLPAQACLFFVLSFSHPEWWDVEMWAKELNITSGLSY